MITEESIKEFLVAQEFQKMRIREIQRIEEFKIEHPHFAHLKENDLWDKMIAKPIKTNKNTKLWTKLRKK